MTSAMEKILAQLNTLTPVERKKLRDLLENEQPSQVSPRHASLIDQVRGKYSFVPTSSETFAAGKDNEIDIEQ
jgi:hypothetical protein